MAHYLFDFDGTLVDSMPTYAGVMLRILDENGITYDNNIIKIITPLGLSGTADYYIRQMGVKMSKEQLMGVLKTLTPREEMVLKLRFGLEDGRNRTLEEVGKEFNVTRERIRQIEAKALRKLRHPSRSKRLKDFLN